MEEQVPIDVSLCCLLSLHTSLLCLFNVCIDLRPLRRAVEQKNNTESRCLRIWSDDESFDGEKNYKGRSSKGICEGRGAGREMVG